MLWRNSRSTALLARTFEHRMCLFQTRNASAKKRSLMGDKLYNLKKEEKLLFGRLIETKKEKVRRIKLENKGVIPKVIPSIIHSELAWALESTSRLTVLKIKKDELVSEGEDNIVQTNVDKTITNCDMKLPKSEESAISDCSIKVFPITPKLQNIIPKTPKKKDPLLPKPIVKHLLDFPIFEKDKSIDDKWFNESKILSVSPMDDKPCLKFPSVTKILTATMSEEAKAVLERWKMRMIEQLGLRGFEIYQAELLNDGKILHSAIMNHFNDKPYEVPNRIKQSFLSLDEVLKNVESVRALESHVIHSRLLYRGIVDCVAVHRGDLCLIDWKKSDKAKDTIGSTYDAPLQLASYIGALNSDSKYPFQIKKGIIVVAYTSGEPAKVHEVSADSLHFYWKLWLQRLQNYHIALNPS